LIHSYGNADAWDRFIDGLAKLPPEFRVLGINDYVFLDGYKKVLAAKAAGKLPNIELLLPVIELRIDKFGGSSSGLSRVNYHVIFSDEIDPDVIESQFLSALCSKYILTPAYDSIRTSGKWVAVPTRKSIEDLGRQIINSVPTKEQSKFGAPLLEGFNNLCLSLDSIREVLESTYFAGKTLTAVGKTEWADIKWNDHSIADKKTIINGADLVFTASGSAGDWSKAQQSLTASGVNDRLLDCSDAHQHANSKEKDRLANCFTWIKADATFEGLKQAVFEYHARVYVGDTPPIEPLLQIKKVKLTVPAGTALTDGERTDVFCLRGTREISFSPYLTCIIGGRGTGKSTLLNLIHEKLDPGSTEFFRKNSLSPDSVSIDGCVDIDGISEQRVVEFLQQNEIEQFASDQARFTSAIFARLRKLDTKKLLTESEASVDAAILATRKQLARLANHHELLVKLSDSEKELNTQKGIVESFENSDYKRINDGLGVLNRELNGIRTGRARLESLVLSLRAATSESSTFLAGAADNLNAYDQQVRRVVEAVQKAIDEALAQQSLRDAAVREKAVIDEVQSLRTELETFLKARGLSAENLADVGKVSERMAQLNDDIESLKSKVEALRVEIGQFTPLRKYAEEYQGAVEALLAPLNADLKALSVEVKPIKLLYRFNQKAFNDSMVQYVADAIGRLEGRAARADYVANKLGSISFAALSDRDSAIKLVPNDGTVYAKALRDYLTQGVNFDTLKLQAECQLLDVRKLGQIQVLYDAKPLESSSFGQRCTAAIVVLLLLGNMPIVIDEPEAHLDSSLIAKYLVDLVKGRKKHRQIIFATHNANFVINGDADLIHCMSMDESHETTVIGTTIENVANRELLLALEGGEQAFQQRERRYGID